MTSLGYIFTMGKAQVNIIFGHKIFTCQAIFNIFVALFTSFEMLKNDKITFCRKCFRTR